MPHRGIALIIFAGGGYHHLSEHEGRGYAEYFFNAGVACFVVSYRLGTDGHRHPAMLEDALAAIGTIRSRAAEFGVDPWRIGVMGSSAGGHLAAHALVAWDKRASAVSLRPDFGILCYPVITFCDARPPRRSSFVQLTGGEGSDALIEELSCEKHVSANTPPCFIWHGGEDSVVPAEHSLLFASALRKNGIPVELHLYAKGVHGSGLKTPFPWAAECLLWLGETIQKNITSP
jgi:acetyl esterase/lipase